MWIFLSSLAFCKPESEFRQGMWMLNGWGVGNIISSLPASFSSDPQLAAYHQMNVGWNLVNIGLSSYGLLNHKTVEPKKMANVFWLNTALDVIYMTGGYWLREQGRKTQNPEWMGWGESIMIQGGFLFVFDGIMGWRMQHWHQKTKRQSF